MMSRTKNIPYCEMCIAVYYICLGFLLCRNVLYFLATFGCAFLALAWSFSLL